MSTVKWVARRPPEAMAPPVPRRRPRTPTPRYAYIPQWGLHDEVKVEQPEQVSRLRRWGRELPTILLAVAVLSGLNAVLQIWQYSIILRNRSAPVGPNEAAIAAGGMWTFGVLAAIGTIVAMLAFAGWLRDQRQRVFGARNLADPRPRWQLLVGVMVPVVNWFWPVGFVMELREQHAHLPARRTSRLLRLWWVGWLATSILTYVTVITAYRATGLQWQANAVFLAIVANLAAVGFALVTRWMIANVFISSADLTRWVVA